MTKTILFGLLSLLIFLAPMTNAESTAMSETVNPILTDENPLYFSPLPTRNSHLNVVKIQPVANYLSDVLNRLVKTKLDESYENILLALANHDIQFPELGSLHFLSLKKKNLNIIRTSEIMPSFVMVANPQNLTPETLKITTQALLNYNPAENNDVNSQGYSPYTSERFETFNQNFPNRTIPSQNNRGIHA